MARGAVTRFGSTKAFTGHRSGGGGAYLKKWKDKGKIDIWIHIKEMPLAMWRHQIPNIVPTEDRQTRKKTVHVWSRNVVCFENERTLDGQYFRDKDTGERKHPPKRCGLCKLVEWCYQQCVTFEEHREDNEKLIAAGKTKKVKGIEFTTPLFVFEGDVDDERRVLHIGGICNLFRPEKLNDEQKAAMAEAKISPKNAWQENTYAKCQYALCVVNNDRPEDGVQIAVETSGLGDKVKKVLNDVLEEEQRAYEDEPYCIRLKYDEHEKDMNKMYSAIPMRKIKPTPRILKLIRGDAPSDELDKLTETFNQQSVRAMLERYCVEEFKSVVPWDDLFPTKEQEKKWEEEDEASAKENARDDDSGPRSVARDDDDDEDEEDDEEEQFECDNEDCDAVVKASDKKCPKCGMKFDTGDDDDDDENDAKEPEPEPEPEKPKMRTRSEAKREEKEKKAAKGSKKSEPEVAEDNQGDEIPF